jgi:hypothetical protein
MYAWLNYLIHCFLLLMVLFLLLLIHSLSTFGVCVPSAPPCAQASSLANAPFGEQLLRAMAWAYANVACRYHNSSTYAPGKRDHETQ